MDRVTASPGDIGNRIAFDEINREFIDWKVLTYIAFYREGGK